MSKVERRRGQSRPAPAELGRLVCRHRECGAIMPDSGRSCRQPRNRARADVVAAADVVKRFALVAALDRLALLVIGELERSAHSLPARHGSRSAFAGARADQVAFKLCQAAVHGQH
jgi:hypothetical protein